MSNDGVQIVGGVVSNAAAVTVGACVPMPIDPATGAVRTTSTGGGGGVVRGDKTADVFHASPTDCVDTRAHGYMWADADSEWRALCSSDSTAVPYSWGPIFKRIQLTGSAIAGLDAAPQVYRTPLCTSVLPAWGVNLYDDWPYSLKVEAVCTASTGTGWRVVGLDAPSQGLIVSPRCIDYDGDPAQPLVDTNGKAVVILGLPEPLDTEDAPDAYTSLGVDDAEQIAASGPIWLMSIQASYYVLL